MHKRDFLRTLGGAAIGFALSPAERQLLAATPPAELARREDFWSELRARYVVPTEFIHLEHGYYSMQSQPVLERYLQHIREVNAVSSRYMRTVQYPNKERVQGKLAAIAGCSPRELIITRNTTESLDTVISGFDWKPGDEAVMGVHDYGAMLDQFSLMARRWGITNTRVTVPLDPASDDEVVQVYANAITPRTKLLMVCHMINITGHVLPVRKICDMAHARGVPVMVDGAHAFAQLDFRIPDLDCDFYGASLHKWLGTPLGAGILYVKPSAVETLWPLYGDEGYAATDIRKLNHTGTHPVATDLAIEDAIVFHETIGIQRKEERLRWLQRYWTTKVRGLPRIKVFTPRDPARTGAIANVGIEGMKPGDLATALMEKYRIFTVAINTAGVTGVRVTPQLFTTTQELDALVRALTELTKG